MKHAMVKQLSQKIKISVLHTINDIKKKWNQDRRHNNAEQNHPL